MIGVVEFVTFEIFRTLEAPITTRIITVVPRAGGYGGLHIHKQTILSKYFTFLVLGEFSQGVKNVHPDAHSQAAFGDTGARYGTLRMPMFRAKPP